MTIYKNITKGLLALITITSVQFLNAAAFTKQSDGSDVVATTSGELVISKGAAYAGVAGTFAPTSETSIDARNITLEIDHAIGTTGVTVAASTTLSITGPSFGVLDVDAAAGTLPKGVIALKALTLGGKSVLNIIDAVVSITSLSMADTATVAFYGRAGLISAAGGSGLLAFRGKVWVDKNASVFTRNINFDFMDPGAGSSVIGKGAVLRIHASSIGINY
jgi:hypothetical protein